MKHVLAIVFVLFGLIAGALGFTQLVGHGILREAPAWGVSLGSTFLLILPIVGIAGLMRLKPQGWVAGFSIWPLVMLLGMPMYFPGERSLAMATGLGFLAAPWGPERSTQAAALGEQVAMLMGAELLAGRPPVPQARAVDEPGLAVVEPAPRELEGNQIVLPYEGAGRSLRIPVVFEGRSERELWMMYDTGATYTTLTTAALEELGMQVPDDAPEISLNTANGERRAQLVMLDKVWLGGFPVEGVTVAVCEVCGDDEVSGLLGLNVSGQFTVTVDPGRRELVLAPHEGAPDRQLDVLHWVEIEASATAYSDGRVEVDLSADSQAPRAISQLDVGIHCGDGDFQATLVELDPGGRAETQVSLPRGTQCDPYHITLDHGRW